MAKRKEKHKEQTTIYTSQKTRSNNTNPTTNRWWIQVLRTDLLD